MKVFSVFFIILLLNRLKIRLSFSLLIGSAALGLWMNLGASQIFESALNSLTDIQAISLILIVAFIMLMSRLMEDAGHMERVSGSCGCQLAEVLLPKSESVLDTELLLGGAAFRSWVQMRL
jgi:hypothetical protein